MILDGEVKTIKFIREMIKDVLSLKFFDRLQRFERTSKNLYIE